MDNDNLKIVDFGEIFDELFMKSLSFSIDGREIKSGKLKLFNIKEFNLRFDLMDSEGEIKIFEVPFPFQIKKLDNTLNLYYTIDSITALDDLKLLDKWEASSDVKSRLYNKILKIVVL